MRIGVRNVTKIGFMRVRFACMNKYWRYKVLHNKQSNKYMPAFFLKQQQSKNLSFIKSLYDADISRQQIIEIADAYTQKKFCFLGSSAQRYTHIPWHTDFRLQQQNSNTDVTFDNTSFYVDLSVQQGYTDAFVKDIKVPWELSRFQYLYVLGNAYEHTHQQSYVHTFQRYVTDWLDNNPYLCGINWQCPMEVGIRAINWIVAWEFFKDDTRISSDFRERFIASLYDHMRYLENNWEFYDSRTNNHYLSNLVAYLYLCWFFGDLPGVEKKHAWVVQEIMCEFEKQVFTEGTSYEGSTNYHCLVTELFYHAYLLFQVMNIKVPEHFKCTLSRMFDFIGRCSVNGKTIISIGDNDSGKILYFGLTQSIITQMQTQLSLKLPVFAKGFDRRCWRARPAKVKVSRSFNVSESARTGCVSYFPHFGLSVIKNDAWHVTLRHHAYNALQPSGHFHNDVASITLAVNGIPVIVDPGSFVYTPSTIWRNYFRSVAVHNTSFVVDVEPVPLNKELFGLHMPERFIDESPVMHNDSIVLYAKHNLYARLGLQFKRQVMVSDNNMQITDAWIGGDEQSNLISGWNFTLAPDIIACKQYDGWLLMHQQIPLVKVQSSDITFELHETWVSPAYGQKVATHALRASRLFDNKNVTIEFLKV